jgi:hypothetical protein
MYGLVCKDEVNPLCGQQHLQTKAQAVPQALT